MGTRVLASSVPGPTNPLLLLLLLLLLRQQNVCLLKTELCSFRMHNMTARTWYSRNLPARMRKKSCPERSPTDSSLCRHGGG
jgi:hypothetical protein